MTVSNEFDSDPFPSPLPPTPYSSNTSTRNIFGTSSSRPASRHSAKPSVSATIPLNSAFEDVPEKSTVVQTTFNSINLFIGVGILSMPYTFRVAGYWLGPLMILFCAILSWYTTSILVKSMDRRPGIKTYSDLGEAAFGKMGRWFITVVFFFELFSCGIVYIVLIGDTLMEIIPDGTLFGIHLGLNGLKTLAFVTVMLPTTMMGSLRFLSVGSIIGIIGSFMLGVVLLVDAFSKPEAPGSIYHHAPVDSLPESFRMWMMIPLNIGVIMYNYSGGAVMPNLYRDMKEPGKFSSMLRVTYGVVTAWFLFMSGLGYWMFGREMQEEVYFPVVMDVFSDHA